MCDLHVAVKACMLTGSKYFLEGGYGICGASHVN